MKKVLVTGGAGYIGSVTASELLKAGYDVVIFDNMEMGHASAIPEGATFIEGDLRNHEDVAQIFKNYEIDGILHFAAYSLVGESMENPLKYLRENPLAASVLVEEAMKAGVNKFILSSTAALFGNAKEMPIDESEPIVPGSVYGESKQTIERMLYWLHETKGLRYACLRYFNACGATDEIGEHHDPETHLIPLVLQVALGKRDKIFIYGDDYPTRDGTGIRDYIHVVDLASAHILALEALDEKETLTYNLGNGQGYSVREVIDAARKVTGHAIPAEVVERRAGDPPELIASSSAIKKDLGWNPKYPGIEEIVESAWKWHKAHPEGYK